jgi:superfamily I DNA/RNA helicase
MDLKRDDQYKESSIKAIRRTAKCHFTTDCSQIKFSTIHSFKGWESKTIIFLLQPDMQSDELYDGHDVNNRDNVPALIYTAITRAKGNLFIINLENKHYHTFFENNMK